MSPVQRYTPEQTAQKRAEVLAGIHRSVTRVMERHPALGSAVMLVAQFWNDEAEDAVHCDFVFSQLPAPDLDAYARAWEEGGEDAVNLPAGLEHDTLQMLAFGYDRDAKESLPSEYEWDSNDDAIPVFAAFTKEGADQEMSLVEAGAPYAVFRRTPAGVEVEVVGTMLRPWLDGVAPVLPEDGEVHAAGPSVRVAPPAPVARGWLDRLLGTLLGRRR